MGCYGYCGGYVFVPPTGQCSSVNCHSHCYSYGCGGTYRAPRPSYNYPFASEGDKPTANFINSIRSAVVSELSARGVGRTVANAATAKTNLISKTNTELMTDLKNCINAMGGSIKTVYTGIVKKSHGTELRDSIQTLMRDCVCNSDCGANAWCTCYGDCGCNY